MIEDDDTPTNAISVLRIARQINEETEEENKGVIGYEW